MVFLFFILLYSQLNELAFLTEWNLLQFFSIFIKSILEMPNGYRKLYTAIENLFSAAQKSAAIPLRLIYPNEVNASKDFGLPITELYFCIIVKNCSLRVWKCKLQVVGKMFLIFSFIFDDFLQSIQLKWKMRQNVMWMNLLEDWKSILKLFNTF